MAPPLPTSLSPHVCILSSPDVHELFESSGLPPLAQILQSFVPLPQVTTRTTSLTSVPHSSFALRFSDLAEIELATHEDEEQRAGRTMDWIGSRMGMRAAGWVQTMEAPAATNVDGAGKEGIWKDRTPWWEEVKRCVEGEVVPNSDEGWNHPAAIILAVSTRAVNPLQALQDLNSRPLDFPPWVDTTHLRYYLIVHPAESPLTDPIAEALFNAVKKQYGLHSYLLPLALPTNPPPPPVPIPALLPRLDPPVPSFETPPFAPHPGPAGLDVPDTPRPLMSPAPRSPGPSSLVVGQHLDPSPATSAVGHTISLAEGDIQQTAKFVREFVVMSLVPWMEKCVVDWNENFSSTRRLPSRLFSSTRRLFGSSAASPSSANPPALVHGPNSSVSSISSRFTSHGPSSSITSIASTSSSTGSGAGIVTQQRRLAEFATMLGDYKLATSVWEALRKDGRGGSDVLPLLLAPSPALSLHASHALSTLHSLQHNRQHPRSPAYAQLRAISYAVRWAIGIDTKDFLSPILEGERWLVQAAGGAEEPPTSVLLAHAAFLSEKKSTSRRSALWYLFAADRLEKAGIKPLAMYLFRKAHELYQARPVKDISPSFWESEGVEANVWRGFEAVLPGIEHELGRLLYTMGNTEGAVKYFLGLLSGSSSSHSVQSASDVADGYALSDGQISTDKVYLEDFRVALKHFKTTERDKWEDASLKLPITFCQVRQTRVRFPGDATEGDLTEWDKREEDWATFWAPRGKEKLERSSRAAVNENFWVDIVMRNPLGVDVTLSGLTIALKEASSEDSTSAKDFVEVEVIDDITLAAKETRTIPISVRSKRPASLVLTHINYVFLSLLPAVESLAIRGRRLEDTPQQRQNKVYAPDVVIQVDVEEASQRLHVSFIDDGRLILSQGEYKPLRLWMSNTGTKRISEIWMVAGREDEIWIDSDESNHKDTFAGESEPTEVLSSHNSLAPVEPYRIPIPSELAPGENTQFALILHSSQIAEQDLCLLFIFREAEGATFHCTKVVRQYEVKPIIQVTAASRPSASTSHSFLLDIDVENVSASSGLRLSQLTTMSPMWACTSLEGCQMRTILPHQIARLTVGASPWQEQSGCAETVQFVTRKLKDVLQGLPTDPSSPPPIDVMCSHVAGNAGRSVSQNPIRHFVHSSKRNHGVRSAITSHPYIPAHTHHSIFPLYNPYAVDWIIFWELADEGRFGLVLVPGLTLGANHSPLNEIVDQAETAKVKRSMYAETQRERQDVLGAIRDSEWNAEMDPVVVTINVDDTVEHDFRGGPCSVPIAFVLRNYSPTNPTKVVLKLASDLSKASSPELLPPHYSGRLTHRSILEPLASVIFDVKLWVSRPGNFVIDGWLVETEVGEHLTSDSTPSGTAGSAASAPWRSRHLHYKQAPLPEDQCCVTVLAAAH